MYDYVGYQRVSRSTVSKKIFYVRIKRVENKGNGNGCNNKKVKEKEEGKEKKTTYVRETNTASP